MDNDEGSKSSDVALCASCDRCRARKTKCDGKRPCGNCASKYMKKHKLTSIEGIDLAEFECVYSPAKRRGPVPGRSGNVRKVDQAFSSNGTKNKPVNGVATTNSFPSNGASIDDAQLRQMVLQQTQNNLLGSNGGTTFDQGVQQQLNLLQRLQQQQQQQTTSLLNNATEEPTARRVKMDLTTTAATSNKTGGIPRTISNHTHLLDRSDSDGNRLRAYYRLSVDELFRLPQTPTDEEYAARLGVTPSLIPGSHLAALSACRFAEVALGAVVHNEVPLAMELCNAVVHCLRECVQEPVQTMYLFEVARAYFLLGVFRACRGDMERYFKYRRVTMTYLAKLEKYDSGAHTLIASISFLDSWAYMIYNADENKAPFIDATFPIPTVEDDARDDGMSIDNDKHKGRNASHDILTDPKNQIWIQGEPAVYLNNEAPLPARSLDAIACAVRSCCDQANTRFAAIARAAEVGADLVEAEIPSCTLTSPTQTAILASNNELCSRNLVLSAFTLMQQHDANTQALHRNQGQHLIISAMDAFLENSDEDGSGGFTDSQIQSLLSVCNTAIENPLLLHHAGSTYHMVSNAAILLCHLVNGMYAMKVSGASMGEMEDVMFEEVMDTLTAVRKLLTIHRRKLSVKLRCHGIPRPTNPPQPHRPLIDLGETILCACRGCQGFVLMACSPCVAAERAMSAQERLDVENVNEQEASLAGDLDKELDDLGAEFNLDDDALLGMISQLITN